ncbi:MAG: sensor histidine kinase, partial [Flavobacteriales bacterium]
MIFTDYRNTIRWIMIVASFAIVSLILWKTFEFFQYFKVEERNKMKQWSFAQTDLLKSTDLESNIGDLPLYILESNTTTPMIIVHKNGNIEYKNIDEEKAKDSIYLKNLILKFKGENKPIEILYKNDVFATLYYGNSELLNKLKYYPLALLLIIFLFSAVIYFFYKSNKNATQNKLWSGMAKETAHQIGTPLSSLIGWA